jgi:hypothetical protein
MPPDPDSGWLRRIGWLLLIWCASVAALALVAWLIRLAMRGAGMTT